MWYNGDMIITPNSTATERAQYTGIVMAVIDVLNMKGLDGLASLVAYGASLESENSLELLPLLEVARGMSEEVILSNLKDSLSDILEGLFEGLAGNEG